MNIVNRILSVSLSICLLIVIFELVRRGKLKEKYAILWLVAGICILLLAVSENLLIRIVYLLGIRLPINGVFFLGLFFLIMINLHFSIVISSLVEHNKKIIQELALLEAELKHLNKK